MGAAPPGSGPDVASRLRARRDEVLSRWEARVRAELPEASGRSQPLLIDTLPLYIEHLAQELAGGEAPPSTVPLEHGSERARLFPGYSSEDVVFEYQLFRLVVLEVLDGDDERLGAAHIASIVRYVDRGIRDALRAFLAVTHEMNALFTAALTHDLRSPLQAAAMAADLVRERGDGETQQLARRIGDNLGRANAMIGDLLDAGAVRSGHRLLVRMEPLELTALVAEAARDVEEGHGARVIVEPSEPIHGWWGRAHLRRAMENLLINAVKYGEPGGPITVGTSSTHGRVMIRVHNRGAAIPPEILPTLFEPYRRAPSARQKSGWGIGLTLVKGTAEAHGGSVVVESSDQAGTTFSIDMLQDAR